MEPWVPGATKSAPGQCEDPWAPAVPTVSCESLVEITSHLCNFASPSAKWASDSVVPDLLVGSWEANEVMSKDMLH